MLVNPYSVAVAVGVPMQYTFANKLLIFGGRDLLTFRIHRLIPSVNSPAETAAAVALDEVETDLPSGLLNVNGGVAYQFQENMAVESRVGVTTKFDSDTDADDRDPPVRRRRHLLDLEHDRRRRPHRLVGRQPGRQHLRPLRLRRLPYLGPALI